MSLCASHLLQSETMMEEKDILIGEGRTLDRPISDLEKLHIIVGYALSRRDIRYQTELQHLNNVTQKCPSYQCLER